MNILILTMNEIRDRIGRNETIRNKRNRLGLGLRKT